MKNMKNFELLLIFAFVANQCLALSLRGKRQNSFESDEEDDFDDERNQDWSPNQGFQGQFPDPEEFGGDNFPGQGQNFPNQQSGFPGGQENNFPNQGQNLPSRRPNRPTQRPGQSNGGRRTTSPSQNFPGQDLNLPGRGQNNQLSGSNSRQQSTQRTPRPQTNASTPRTNATASTTQSSSVQACIRNCPVTPEYNPVCGSDRVTYDNPGRLTCAQACGVNVSLLRMQRCPASTTAAPQQ